MPAGALVHGPPPGARHARLFARPSRHGGAAVVQPADRPRSPAPGRRPRPPRARAGPRPRGCSRGAPAGCFVRPGEIAKSVSRGAFYLAIEKVAALISGTLYFALLLRWMGPTKYGIITLGLSIVGLASMATGNFEMYLERYAAEHDAQGRLLTLRRAHRLALALKLGLGALVGVALVALAPLLAHQFSTP